MTSFYHFSSEESQPSPGFGGSQYGLGNDGKDGRSCQKYVLLDLETKGAQCVCVGGSYFSEEKENGEEF